MTYRIKFLLPAFGLLLLTTASAQMQLGLQAGIGIAYVDTDYSSFRAQPIPAFNTSAILTFPLLPSLSVQTGLSFQSKGYKLKNVIASGHKATIYPLYLQLPAQLIYTSDKYFFGLGPYWGFAVGGKYRSNYRAAITNKLLTFGEEQDDDFRARDFGLGVQIGICPRSTRIGLSYEWGITNVYPTKSRLPNYPLQKMQLRNIQLFVAYMIGPKKQG